MSSIPAVPAPPPCELCGQSMQLAEERSDGQGRIVSRRYICGCPREGVHQKNIHTGDQTKR